MTTKNIEKTIIELKIKKLEKERLNDEIKALEAVLKNELTNRGLDQMIVGAHKIKLTTYSAEQFNKSKLKADWPELIGEYSEMVQRTRFTVS